MNVTVKTASKRLQNVTEAPAAVSIITATDIQRHGYQTLSDVLNGVAGFYSFNDRSYKYIGTRGFSRPGDLNTRVLLLLNGHRLNDSIYSAAGAGTDFPLDLALVDRIEIIRGPGSALYGTNAFFCTINIISKTGSAFQGVEVSGTIGNYDTRQGRFTVSQTNRPGHEMLLSLSRIDSDGEPKIAFSEYAQLGLNQGVAENCDRMAVGKFFTIYSAPKFSFFLSHSDREKTIPTAPYGILFNDSTALFRDSSLNFGARYDWRKTERWEVFSRVFYDEVGFKGTSPYLAGRYDDFTKGKRFGGEVQFTHPVNDRHTLIGGCEMTEDFEQTQKGDWVGSPVLDSDESSGSQGVFLQSEYRLTSSLTFHGGFRRDHFEDFGETTNPRFALLYSCNENTSFKAIMGKAFRAPNAYERFYHDQGISIKSNPDLSPETLSNRELVCEHRFGPHTSGFFTVYQYDVKQLITQITDPVDGLMVFRNQDHVSAQGIEFEVQTKRLDGQRDKLGFSLQKAEDSASGKTLTNSPPFTGFFSLSRPLAGQTSFLTLENTYSGPRKTLGGNSCPAQFQTNLTFFQTRFRQLGQLTISIQNLFNKGFFHPGSDEHLVDRIPQEGRRIFLTLSRRW